MRARPIRPFRMLVAAVGAAAAMLAILAQPAAAAGVSNPGDFSATVQAGSSLTLHGSTGDTVFDVGTPACSDGEDNDLDGNVDAAADAECDSGSDANERLSGPQAYNQPRVDTSVDGAGGIDLPTSGVVFPAAEICTDTGLFGIWCLGATIVGDAATTGTIDPEGPTAADADGTISLGLDVRVQLVAATGFPGLDEDECQIAPGSGTVTSSNYDKTNGNANLTNTVSVGVPPVVDCGSFFGIDYDETINDQLGLSGGTATADIDMDVQIRNAANDPVLP